MNVWGLHMGEHVGVAPVEGKYVAIGWSQLGDLKSIASSRDKLKKALAKTYPDITVGAKRGNAGVLYRFVNDVKKGDIVVYPSKIDRMVNIGKVVGGYRYVASDEHSYPNQRGIEWLGHFPRSDFSQAALNEIGAFITLFSIKRYRSEFLNKVGLAGDPDEVVSNNDGTAGDDDNDTDDNTATETVSKQAVQTTEDFIIKQLYNKLDGYDFEYFIAHLLECMGYKTRVTRRSRDGGVDVIAHNDELGFEPPIIKVQCKRTTDKNGEPEVNQLLGVLGEGEYALFVNLGAYSEPARALERNKAKLRLIGGEELVDLILEHYDKLSAKYKMLLPLKNIYVPDLS